MLRFTKFHTHLRTVISILVLSFCISFTGAKSVKAYDFNLGCSKEIAVTAVNCAATGLGKIFCNVKGERERIDVIRAFIEKFRFYSDRSGYFYVYNFDCINIAHATQKDLPGKDLYNHQDTKGKYVIRELSAAARKGGGFVEYYWVRPKFRGEHRKLGYVEPIPNTDYFIGTGVYLGE